MAPLSLVSFFSVHHNHRHTYIDLWHGTLFSLAWLVVDGNFLARLIGGGCKKVCIVLVHYSSLLLSSRVLLLFFLNGTWYRSWAAGLSCTDPVIWEFPFLRGSWLARGMGCEYVWRGFLVTLDSFHYLWSQHRWLTTIGQIKLPLTHWPSLEIHVTETDRRAQVRPICSILEQ